MSPILGIWASQNYSRYSLPTSFDSIATVNVGAGGSSFIEFTSIPSTYTHLQIRVDVNTNVGEEALTMQLNSDTGSNYSWHQLNGTGSVSANGGSSQTYMVVCYLNRSGVPGSSVIDILDYANTNKYKTLRELCGSDNNTVGGQISFRSGSWRNTNAITSIKISSAGTINQYSKFSLYGIKGV